MKEIKLKGLDLSVFQKTLDNGLDIIFIPYQNKKNYFMTYATKYGSTKTSFIPNDSKKLVKTPDGIAHFLEHKMFEQENGSDPFSFFSESGTGANASTSFDSTQYICYGTKNFLNNLKYLINFVNSPYFTDENVEKEKGIIAEELKMYLDIPDFQIETKLKEAIYDVNPRRIDIGGTVDEVNKIKKEDLYLCYNNFYVPNNMFILIAGNFDTKQALELIEKELSKKESIKLPKLKKYKEKATVHEKEVNFEADIKVPKIAYGLKIPTKSLGISDDLELDLYLSMLTTIIFGSSSEFRERVREEKLINNFYNEWETIEDYRVFSIYSSTPNPDLLLAEITQELENINIKEEDFLRMKKVWIANEVKIADYLEATVNNIYDDIIRYNKIIPNRVDLIRKMKLTKLNTLISKIDFTNTSIIRMLPKDK